MYTTGIYVQTLCFMCIRDSGLVLVGQIDRGDGADRCSRYRVLFCFGKWNSTREIREETRNPGNLLHRAAQTLKEKDLLHQSNAQMKYRKGLTMMSVGEGRVVDGVYVRRSIGCVGNGV